MRDRDVGRSLGFGFVTFFSRSEAECAVNDMNDQELDGRRIKVKFANDCPCGSGGKSFGGGGYSGGGGGGYNSCDYSGGDGYSANSGGGGYEGGGYGDNQQGGYGDGGN